MSHTPLLNGSVSAELEWNTHVSWSMSLPSGFHVRKCLIGTCWLCQNSGEENPGWCFTASITSKVLVQLHVPQGLRGLPFCCPATTAIMQHGLSGPGAHVWEGIPVHMHSRLGGVCETRVCAGGRTGDAVNLRRPQSAPIVLCNTDLCSCTNHVTVWVCRSSWHILLWVISTADLETPSLELNMITLALPPPSPPFLLRLSPPSLPTNN